MPNYPYVDLLSDDRQIFVQVSTAQNVPTKIKDTLENIKNGKKEYVSDIKEVYFFVLHNESIDDVKDYAGDSRIGKIDFEQAKHLITTQKIVARAMSDIEFQKALYDSEHLDEMSLKQVGEWWQELQEDFRRLRQNHQDYLREFYDVLHTTGYQYINNDIDIYLKSRGAMVPN